MTGGPPSGEIVMWVGGDGRPPSGEIVMWIGGDGGPPSGEIVMWVGGDGGPPSGEMVMWISRFFIFYFIKYKKPKHFLREIRSIPVMLLVTSVVEASLYLFDVDH